MSVKERDITEYLKHTIIETLKDAGCPICRLVKDRETKAFWWFFSDNYHETSVLQDLMDNSFFCDHHAGILSGGDHDSLSYVFQFLIQGDINRFNKLIQSFQKNSYPTKRTNLASVFQRHQGNERIVDDLFAGYLSCRFCNLNANVSRYIEESFAELIRDDASFRDSYVKSHGLCRRHFIEVLKLCDDKASDEFLLSDMLRRLNNMKDNFDLYFHRLDYRFAGEPKGQEQDTWMMALKYYSSNTKREP